MDIGIIGAGNIGSTLAKQLTALGHQVAIANSRGPATLSQFAAETGVSAATAEEAAGAKDLVIIAVPQLAISDLPLDLLRANAAVVVDAGNYYPTRDGVIELVDSGATDSEWVSTILGRPVVKAFNNIVAQSLAAKGTTEPGKERVALAVAGDDPDTKKLVQELVRTLGFDAIDAGSLADSWRQQPGTPAYCRDLNANELSAALAQADSSQVASYRKEADEAAAPYLVPFHK